MRLGIVRVSRYLVFYGARYHRGIAHLLRFNNGFRSLLPPDHRLFALFAISLWSAKKDERSAKAEVYNRADYLYEQYQIEALVKYLHDNLDTNDLQFVWRYARAICELGKVTTDSKRKQELFSQAFELIQSGLELPGSETCGQFHKWYAIILNYLSETKGTKEQLLRAFEVKEHFLKAVEANPHDPTSLHLLGTWAFTFADLAWYERKLASVVFATPPQSTYEEALEFFEKAEAVEPNFYSSNLLMLGKTYLKLGQKTKAKEYFERTVKFAISTQDDVDAHDEAEKLLRSVK